ncbi:TIMELESS-interacting protein isoform X2 [Sorghum bicolor]|uniref:TIMELESS-interacting protein isoform X2 n=1 Tax=Sorghum bicolor TaxID=4558 RepID=UPI000B425517|nr:TIMELESS-interacting protein isoform X2 [Sorghum bicolor]|eukprot:XP_021305212.1 TIMELESS-interacting protein isoform X2 [Sorghum bicolor]
MAAAAPTGCFKCGRPGHWSRDCPSDAAAPTNPGHPSAAAASRFNAKPRPSAAAPEGDGTDGGAPPQPQDGKGKKKKKERATRPKLTPDLLLSDGGIGFVLRYLPKAFKPRARPGHEVEDLGNLIKLYADWHSRLIPYYSFEQFVRKVEKLGAGNRVRRCVSELRDRVARGGDPTLLYEPPVHEDMPEDGTAPEDPIFGSEAPLSDNHVSDPVRGDADPPMETNDMDPMEEDLLNEIYEKAADEPWIPPAGEGTNKEIPEPSAPKEVNSLAQKPQDGAASDGPKRAKIELTEEQKARMEANRLKALERAAARARASQPT